MPMLITLRMRLPVWPFHSPLRTLLAKAAILSSTRVDLRHDIFAVDQDRCVFGRAQGDVQHGALLGDVDLVAAEHGVDVLGRPAAAASSSSSCSVSSVMRFLE